MAGKSTGTVSATEARRLIDSTTSATEAMPSSVATITAASTGSLAGRSQVPKSPKTKPSMAKAHMKCLSHRRACGGPSRSKRRVMATRHRVTLTLAASQTSSAD